MIPCFSLEPDIRYKFFPFASNPYFKSWVPIPVYAKEISPVILLQVLDMEFYFIIVDLLDNIDISLLVIGITANEAHRQVALPFVNVRDIVFPPEQTNLLGHIISLLNDRAPAPRIGTDGDPAFQRDGLKG
ncbi:hypothetical protein ES705_46109 [subsurface metagenome]